MTQEEFKNLKVGDLVYAELTKLNEWHLCYVYAKNEFSASLFNGTLHLQPDNNYLFESSVSRSPEEMHTINYFIDNDLVKDSEDGWSFKNIISNDKKK